MVPVTEASPPPPLDDLLDEPLELDPDTAERVVGALPNMVFALLGGCLAVAGVALVVAVGSVAALPTLREARSQTMEREAIAALREVAEAQARFRREDLDANKVKDFGALGQLGLADLLDPDLASGVKNGYRFEVGASAVAPTAEWMAVANPIGLMNRGGRSFVINHEGVVHFVFNQHLTLDLHTCPIPQGAARVLPRDLQ